MNSWLASLLAVATLACATEPCHAGGWAWTVQAGPGYPARRIPSFREGLDRGDTEWQWGFAVDDRLNDSWRAGMDVGGFELPYSDLRHPPGIPGVGTRSRFRIVNANVHASYGLMPNRRFSPFARFGAGGSYLREEWATEYCSVEFATCYDDIAYRTTRSLEGEIGLGLDSRLTAEPPFVHILLLGEYHYLVLPNYRPGISSLSYLGVSLGLSIASRGAH